MSKSFGSRRLLSGMLVCVLAVLMLGASADDADARFNRLGHSMMCVCGCDQILLECNHVGCQDSARMIKELNEQVYPTASGTGAPLAAASDQAILNWFVAKYGATVLAAPIRGGFDNVAWITPLVAFILAIFGTAYLVNRWSIHRAATATPGRAPAVDDETRARIRRETEYL